MEEKEEKVEELDKKFESNKKSKKGVVTCIIIALIVLLVAGGLFAYYKINSKPKAILKKFVSKLTVENTEKIPETLKANYIISFKVNTNDSESQLVFDEISKCALKTDIQIDFKNKKEIIGAGLTYDNEDVVGGKIIYDSENLYALLEGIYDKYIKMNTTDEMKDTINKAFETAGKTDNNDESKEVLKILKDVFIEEINNSKEVTQEKTTVSVKNKDKKVLKTSIKLSTKDLVNLISKFYTKLSESKIYADKAEDKQDLKEAADQIKATPTNTGDYLIISIYTDGLNNNFKGMSASVYVKESDMNLKIELVKEDKNTYKYVVSGDGQGAYINVATGEIRVNSEIKNKEQEKGSFVITAEIPEIMTKSTKINIELKVDYDAKINSPIDVVDTSNNIEMDKIPQEDYDMMLEKLKLKPLIGPAITSLMSVYTPTDYFDDYDFEDYDFDDYNFDDLEDFYNFYLDDDTETDYTF